MKIKEKKNKKAISLIVLVITILVLSILATVVIINVSNTNVIDKASKTTFKTDMASYKEAFEMYVANLNAENENFDRTSLKNLTYSDDADTFKKIFGEVAAKYQDGLQIQGGKLVFDTSDEEENEILEDLGMVLVATYTEENVPIPNGFYYVGGTKTTGLVISDNEADATNGLTGETDGNQFVWVPVDDYSAFVRGEAKETSSGSGIYKMTGDLDKEKYIEVYTANSWEVEEYNAMCASVKKYGGFYIARFEAGDEDALEGGRTTITQKHTVVSKRGMYVYNHVPWGLNMTSITPSAGEYYYYDSLTSTSGKKETDIVVAGAVYLSQQMAKDNNYTTVVSTLCYGVQWDATLNFVSDKDHNIYSSSGWGNYKDSLASTGANTNSGSLQKTGTNEAWQAKNIYDLAGNAYEWSMEANSSGSRIIRGGFATGSGDKSPASLRYDGPTYNSSKNVGFRVALYIVE